MPRHLLEAEPSDPPKYPPPTTTSITDKASTSGSVQSPPTEAPSKNDKSTTTSSPSEGTTSVSSTDNTLKQTEVSSPDETQDSNSSLLVAPVGGESESSSSQEGGAMAVIGGGATQVKEWAGQAWTSVSSATAFGIPILVFVAVIVVLVIIIIVCACIAYKRYRARKDYNENPQLFAHKPELSGGEEDNLEETPMKAFMNPEGAEVILEEQVKGKLYRVEFGDSKPTGVIFNRLMETTCYFEMEVLALTGEVEIGYIVEDSLEKIQKGSEGMASSGVALSNNGLVQSEGDTVFNYSWGLAYGDVIGIGITKETSKFSERRVWISKNGMLLNTPPEDEMDKWLATIEISAEEREEYDLGKKKQAEEDEEIDEEDQEKMKERQAREREQAMLKRQRISLKTFNPYKFYPAIICQGVKNNKPSIVNINVGGQIFRMNDATFRSGLLKNKSFFGDD